MEDKLIQLKSQENDNVIKVYPYTKAKAITFSNGKTLEEQITNHKHNLASASEDGLISKEDYLKLLNIEPNANKYYHPATHDSNEILHEGKLLSEILKEESQPSAPQEHTHTADDIVTTFEKMFISQSEKDTYADKYTKEESDAKYVHKGESNEVTVSGDISVNSITIGEKFKFMLNEFDELEIINAKTNTPLASLTANGVLIISKEIQELGTT